MALSARELNRERIYTPEEFEERYELVNGKLVKKPMSGDEHITIARLIMKRYDRFDPDERLGKLWGEVTFDVGTGWMPIPDLGFMVAERVPPLSPKSVKGVPDLVVEMHSPSDLRSRVKREAIATKIRNWQEVGVKLIWAINPSRKQIEVYQPGQFEPVQILSGEDELKADPLIPGFTIKVSELFGG